MIRKSKFVTSICAIIISTFAVIPAQAVSPPKNKKIEPCQYAKTQTFRVQNPHYRSEIDKAKQRINNVFYRINQTEQKTKNAQFEAENELKNIKSNFKSIKSPRVFVRFLGLRLKKKKILLVVGFGLTSLN